MDDDLFFVCHFFVFWGLANRTKDSKHAVILPLPPVANKKEGCW